ncbi:hypothetical protein E2C01_024417 [Portunus trituberculatus]|uniref:Uncharacterized protein n=1 Tax=Portunus trituberculatus TaxID=210409 RepID=A0A5B7EC93_PORTR|nr:hypothetical protein [Portunus trituberculatus]
MKVNNNPETPRKWVREAHHFTKQGFKLQGREEDDKTLDERKNEPRRPRNEGQRRKRTISQDRNATTNPEHIAESHRERHNTKQRTIVRNKPTNHVGVDVKAGSKEGEERGGAS